MRTIIIIIAAAVVAAAGSALAEPPQTRTFYNEKGAGGRPGDDVLRRDDLPEREGTNYWARGAPRQHDQLLQREGSDDRIVEGEVALLHRITAALVRDT